MKYQKYTLFFLTLLLFSCTQEHSEEGKTISIDLDNLPTEQLEISPFISEIRFIPLETNPDYMMDRINFMEMDNSDMFFLADKTIYRFSWDGMFLNKFCNEGNGPGEYNKIRQVRIVPGKETLLVSDRKKHKLLEYDYYGKHIGEFSIPRSNGFFEILQSGSIALHLGKMFAYVNDTLCNDLVFLNKDGEVIDRQFKHNNPLQFSFGFPFSRPNNDGSFYYSRQFDFNLYRIKDIGQPEIEWKIDYGEHMGSLDELEGDDITAFMAYREKRKLTRMSRVLNTEEYLSFLHMWIDKKCIHFVNKKTQEMLFFNVDTLNNYGYINKFPIHTPNDTYKDYFITVIEAFDLVEYLAKMSSDEKQTMSARIESFKLLSRVSENDNPVLMLYTIKDQ